MVKAHTVNSDGVPHLLVDHLRAVADAARGFAHRFDAAEVAYWLGYWHDLGKCSKPFQDYLDRQERGIGPRGGPDHKAAGALLALEKFPALEPLSLVIQGHHGGMHAWHGTQAQRPPGHASMREWVCERRGAEDVLEARRIGEQVIPDLVPEGDIPVPQWACNDPRAAEVFIRMCLSAVIDADHLDTEAHFYPGKAAQRPELVSADALLPRFLTGHRAVTGKTQPASAEITEARQAWYDACVAAAGHRRGMFRLAAPTGIGKTLSGMAFALHHAQLHGLERVVVAVPYTSITDQSARAYRAVFDDRDHLDDPAVPLGEGGRFVLEHHSAVDPERGRSPRIKLAAENWSLPVVVTTTVQLLESLLARKPSKVRKLHRLANAVIILDEVQALPIHLLDPTLDVLAELTRHYGATVVLSTATQPAFDVLAPLRDVTAIDITPEPPVALPRRQHYEFRKQPLSWTDLAQEVDRHDQALVVVNTRRDAVDLYRLLRDADTFHLSTLQCGLHRRRVEAEVRRRLTAGQRCRVVSTQVIEAGVDLDFPVGYRAMAPLDSIIQAGGRVNRNGRRPRGDVIVFRPEEQRTPGGDYKTRIGTTEVAWDPTNPPDDPVTLRRYYQLLYDTVSTDRDNIQQLRARLDYPAVHERYRLIKDDTVDVLVTTYEDLPDPRWREWLMQGEIHRSTLRAMQPYLVTVARYLITQMAATGQLHAAGVEGIYIWDGDYDPDVGLDAAAHGQANTG